ncbi:sigma 54-interacting transcriptional regulator [bacterium]|nr:sigma 54-interacting transcriptional regulator [bacterium]
MMDHDSDKLPFAGCSVLVVDDDRLSRASLIRNLQKDSREMGYKVKEAEGGTQALDLFNAESFDLVLTDLLMPDIDGIELLKQIKAVSPKTEVVIITGYGTLSSAIDAMHYGAYDYILKPWSEGELRLRVRKGLEKRILEEKIRESEERYRDLYNNAPDMYLTMDQGGIIKEGNIVLRQTLEYNESDLIGQPFWDFLNIESRQPAKEAIDGLGNGSDRVEGLDLKLRKRSGEEIDTIMNANLIRSPNHDTFLVRTILRDITERNALEKAVRDQKELMDTIISNMTDGLLLVDKDYKIQFMNHSLIQMFGDHTGEDCYKAFSSLEKPCDFCPVEMILKNRKPGRTFITRTIQDRTLEISASVLRRKNEDARVIEVIRDITERKRLEEHLKESENKRIKELKERYRFGNIIGKSHKMQEIYELIQVVAQGTSTVLLQGESGTGKELIARAVHYNSPRHDKPFIEVTCSALSENLLESELFGHVRGSFTGAIRDKVGRFELANGGTIFLDEVGEISQATQVKLLRVLQEHTFERVGGERTIHVDVRIVAATNKDLRKAVEEKEFRDDLYYRLNVVPIYMPPLRERREDIPILVGHFIEKFNEKMGKHITGVSPDVMDLFMEYNWPGNIRELENAIEHGFVRAQTDIIQSINLPRDIREQQPVYFNPDRQDYERKFHLIQVLERYNWHLGHAADSLGINRSTLWRRMKKYKIKK